MKELSVPGQMVLGYTRVEIPKDGRFNTLCCPHSGHSCPFCHSPWRAQVPLPTLSCCSSQPALSHLCVLVLLKPVLQDRMSHDTKSSGDRVTQARSQRVLCFDLPFPPNARNHKVFNSLRNCHEMKILWKNNSCNLVRTRFYFCSYVFRAMLGCGYARGENSQFPTVVVWQKHSRDVNVRRSHCSHMLAHMCLEQKPSPISAALSP